MAAPIFTMMLLAMVLLLQIPVTVLLFIGARQMGRQRLYGLAVAASIAAMLPLHAGFLIGLPVGIWALVVLSRPQVRAAFRRNTSRVTGHSSSASSPRPGVEAAFVPPSPVQSVPSDAPAAVSRQQIEPTSSLFVSSAQRRPRWRRWLEFALVAAVVLAVVAIAARNLLSRFLPEPVGTELTYEVTPRLPMRAPSGGGALPLYERIVDGIERRLNHGGVELAKVDWYRTGLSGWSGTERDGQMLITSVDPPSISIIVGVYVHDVHRDTEGLAPIPDITTIEYDASRADRVERRLAAVGTLELRIMADRTADEALVGTAIEQPHANPSTPSNGGQEVAAAVEDIPKVKWVPVIRRAEEWLANNPDLVSRPDGRGGREALVLLDGFNINQEHVSRTAAGADDQGKPCVQIDFTVQGADLMSRLTRTNLPDPASGRDRHLGFILDGVLHTAPAIRGELGDQASITGQYTREEAENLAAILDAGPIPATLDLLARRTLP